MVEINVPQSTEYDTTSCVVPFGYSTLSFFFRFTWSRKKVYVKLKILKTDPSVAHVASGVTVKAKDNCVVGLGTNRWWDRFQ